MKFGNEAYAKSFAFDDKDEFFKKPWYVHAGVWGSGAANGLIVAGFDEWGKGKRGVLSNIELSSIEFGSRSIGAAIEFGGTNFAKHGKLKGKGAGKKAIKGSIKNIGYILTTYF